MTFLATLIIEASDLREEDVLPKGMQGTRSRLEDKLDGAGEVWERLDLGRNTRSSRP